MARPRDRVGGAANRIAVAMGQKPLSDMQKALVLCYRAEVRSYDGAVAAVAASQDAVDRVLARMHRAGLQVARIRELAGGAERWGKSLGKLQRAIERGGALLDDDAATGVSAGSA